MGPSRLANRYSPRISNRNSLQSYRQPRGVYRQAPQYLHRRPSSIRGYDSRVNDRYRGVPNVGYRGAPNPGYRGDYRAPIADRRAGYRAPISGYRAPKASYRRGSNAGYLGHSRPAYRGSNVGIRGIRGGVRGHNFRPYY